MRVLPTRSRDRGSGVGSDEDALLSPGILSPVPRTALWESENAASAPDGPSPAARLGLSLPRPLTWVPLFSEQPAQLHMETHPLKI